MKMRSVAFELSLTVVLITVFLFGGFAWRHLKWQEQWLMEEVHRGLALASDSLSNGLRYGMSSDHRDEVFDNIQRVARDTRIMRVRIIEHRGRSMISTDPNDEANNVGRDTTTCRVCHFKDDPNSVQSAVRGTQTVVERDTIRAITPVRAEPGCITAACHQDEAPTGVLGVIDVTLSLTQAERSLARNQRKIVAYAIGAIMLAGGLLHLALARRFRRPLREVLSGIRRVSDGDLEHRIETGTDDEFGELARSFNEMNSRLIEIQEGMIKSERLISMGKLAAGVAHEINNPLTGILSYAEDLLEDADSDDPKRKDYEVIVHEFLRCRKIVQSLLGFAKQATPTYSSVAATTLIERAVDVVIRQREFENIEFERRFDESLVVLEVDPVQVQQVLVNLIINAQQAMPEGGTITLGHRLLDDGSRVEFTVADQGQGIPDAVRPKIFEPFFSTKHGKTDGLGLAVCLGIVQQHGGTIEVQSEPGQGSVFRVVLPSHGESHWTPVHGELEDE